MNGFYLTFFKRILPLKQLAALFILSALAVVSGVKLYDGISKDVKIIDNGKPIIVKTMSNSVDQALEKLGITVRPDDYISMPLDASLDNDSMNIINIKRAVPVSIIVDGQLREVWSYKDTVEEVIEENGITLNPLDRFEGLTPATLVTADMVIRVVRVSEEIATEEVDIPFTVVERPNNKMNEGETQIIAKGENGVRAKYYKITYEDGKPVDRMFVNEKVVKAPVDQVVEYGTVMNFRNSRGDLVRYSKVLNMRATAYTSSFEDTGKHPDHPAFGITYTGMRARVGVIAVDPKVIPLGTKLYVEVPGSAPDYGFAIAGDIGSAIKGNNIDLYFDSREEVKKWGRRKVVVYILNEQNDTRWKDNTDACK